MSVFYFAYGSNMLPERLAARIGDAPTPLLGRLQRYQLAFNKKGVDGSGKCNIRECSEGVGVFGAVYRLRSEQLERLVSFEPEYDLIEVDVDCDGSEIRAATFAARAAAIDDSLAPFCWYHGLVLEAARRLSSPEAYVAEIAELRVVADSDSVRRVRHERLWRKGCAALGERLEQT